MFKPGIEWIGLELYKGSGKNDGTVQGVTYFECPMGKGSFVQIDKLSKIVTMRDMRKAIGIKEMRRRFKRKLKKKLSDSLTGQHKVIKTSNGIKKSPYKKENFKSANLVNNGANMKCVETICKSR